MKAVKVIVETLKRAGDALTVKPARVKRRLSDVYARKHAGGRTVFGVITEAPAIAEAGQALNMVDFAQTIAKSRHAGGVGSILS